MNAPFTPVDPHGAYDDVSALLAVIKDPDTHKKRLDELIAQEAAACGAIAALNKMADETRRPNTTAQAEVIVLSNRKTALDAPLTGPSGSADAGLGKLLREARKELKAILDELGLS